MPPAVTPESLRAPGPYAIPHAVGPVKLHAQLGAGATAFTFVGSKPTAGQVVCLKCVKLPSPQLLLTRSPREIRALFNNEANALRRLPAANIAKLEDVIELDDHEGVIALLYAYIDGLNLRSLVDQCLAQRQLLPWESVVDIARDLATALHEAHTDRSSEPTFYCHPTTVHRDLAPSNVMVDIRGSSFLVDFGFARVMDESRLHASREYVGRVAYAAPEYVRDRSYNPRLDLFSLGAVLFEALTGRPPFPVYDNVLRHVQRVEARDYPRVQHLRPDRAPGLDKLADIIDRLLEPDPADRFQSAGAVLTALSTISTGVDRRVLGDLVQNHKSPWQLQLTQGRVKRRQPRKPASGALVPQLEAPLETTQPEKVLVHPGTLDGLNTVTVTTTPQPQHFADTHRDAPVIPTTRSSVKPVSAYPVTSPHEPAAMGRKHPPSGVRPTIPTTNPSTPVHQPSDRTTPLLGTTPSSVDTAASHHPSPHPFAITQTGLPTVPSSDLAEPYPPPSHSAREHAPPDHPELKPAEPHSSRDEHGQRARMGFALIAIATLLTISLFVLGTLHTLWVPLLTDQLGATVIDSFWSPWLTKLSATGCAVALTSAVALLLVWLRSRSKPPA